MQSSSSATNAATCPLRNRLLRCFCNCTELTYDQVYGISKLAVHQLFDDNQHQAPLALNMLKQFLQLGTAGTHPIVFDHVQHAELCVRVRRQPAAALGNSELVDELFDRCPNLDWERRLEAATGAESGSADALDEHCGELLDWLVSSIAADAKWEDFRRELRRKLGQAA